ncbi:glycerophosphodiester phosphodiesterase [Sinomonas atrocyanea]|uniref:Glycerophosphodiester phosphodiesterase n=1 Tax=Sinomonas atrocyanea TaxID=37927 RepID=A0A126ZV65_9MICC|nr:glycerophosphodiester phosphodiesterase family protein [Sinomonas atrocyanea]AMM31048.1 glycerophosphodiester phosphodiesterase [Sinomonas atrocyanea]GEB64817.1 putative glycerophosphoryl diester phosphodiesterase [Sinomonas atrocyanea]GGG55217.1 putative glycerophosphoryl diester phosphodiesterase [Sinomonas atrocyanea]
MTSRPLVYAHRGASARFAEHTRAAYLQALADGADGVECDVHLTRDQHLVLLHDANLDRTSSGTGPVAERTLAQLRELDFSSWKGVRVPDEFGAQSQQLLTLPELLDLLVASGREVGLAIELKHPSPYRRALEDRVLELLRSRGWEPEASRVGGVQVSFMSFDAEAIEHLLSSVPARHVCMLVDDVSVEELRQSAALGALTGGAVANVLKAAQLDAEAILDEGRVGIAGPGIRYIRDHPNRVRAWLEAGLTFRVWTVDAPEDVEHCLAVGVQQITTNRPAEVLAQLGAALG